METKFQGAKLNSVGSYLSKNLYVYPEQSNGTVVDEVEVDIENGDYILDMDISDGRGTWEWYHSLTTTDKEVFDAVTKIAIKRDISTRKKQLEKILENEKKDAFFNVLDCCGSIEECMSETKRLQAIK